MAIVAGNVVYWTSGGVTLQGTVFVTPTLDKTGLPNQRGGEPFYKVNTISGPGVSFASSVTADVRASEVRASA